MNQEETESRIERIEDAVLEIAAAVEDGSFIGLNERVGELLFGEISEDE